MTTAELELAIRDSIQLEAAKTLRELDYICRNIEARHKVEGITPADLAAYENCKRQHYERCARTMVV